MATPNTQTLSRLFDARITEIRAALEKNAAGRSKILSEAADLNTFGRDANAFINQVVGGPNDVVGSWIRGVPLPAMLAAKRRLTVDITPETLVEFGAAYNLSPSAFIAFAQAGLLLINIRDYDPQNSNAERSLEAYAVADKSGFLPKLFEKASKQIYFLAILRDDLLNPLFPAGGSLHASFDQAGILEGSAKAASALSPYSDLVRKAVFRNERPDIIAVRWHWAYAQATQRFSKNLDPDILAGITKAFDAIAKNTSSDIAADYLDLAVHLRYLHLLISAPISACFGGVYNLLLDGEAEFVQAVGSGHRLADYDFVQDPLLDTIRSLQLGQLPSSTDARVPVKYRAPLSTAGVQVFVRYNDVSYLGHYEEPDHQKQLIDYVRDEDGQGTKLKRLEADIDVLLAAKVPEIDSVVNVVAEYADVGMARDKRLKRITKGHQGIELPTTNLLAFSSTPIYEANPKLANLFLAASQVPNGDPSIGGPKDVQRRTYWFPKFFRRPPH